MISFIIPAHNEEEYIGGTIEAILRQPEHFVHEIIVADNNSTDRTGEVAKRYSKVKVVVEKNKGTNWARQGGLNAATGEIVAFIDSDNHVVPGWSEKAVSILQRKKVVAVAGSYDFTDQPWIIRWLMFWGFVVAAYPLYLFFHYILGIGSVVLGGNIAAKRSAMLQAGGFDTSFTFFGDDANTGKRLRKIGYVIFAPFLRTIATSRRYKKHGYIATQSKYLLNYFWVMLFNRPFNSPQDKPFSKK